MKDKKDKPNESAPMQDEPCSSRPPFEICERTFLFALRIVKLCRRLERDAKVPRTLTVQFLKTGTSVGANIEEGQAGQSRADFVSKYSISRKEAREARYWLRLLVASDLLSASDGEPLIQECEELVKILSSIILKAKRL
ncbi:MAG: four helix bundle protein [Gemmataceae bacterium]